jgi:hypothetical protein
MHGYGILYARNGDKYTGEFANNLFDGSGTYEYASYRNEKMEEVPAAKYEGSFKRGRKHGRGVFYQSNGDVYSGLFCGFQLSPIPCPNLCGCRFVLKGCLKTIYIMERACCGWLTET